MPLFRTIITALHRLKPTLALVLVMFISACGDDCEKQCRDSYWEGYNSGEKSGYESGYNEGYEKGYSDGNSVGYASGYIGGSKTFVGESFLPSLGAAIVLSMLIVFIFIFKKQFQSLAGEYLEWLAAYFRSTVSYLSLRRKLARFASSQNEQSTIVAQITALEITQAITSATRDLDFESEKVYILSKLEEYFIAHSMQLSADLTNSLRLAGKQLYQLNGISERRRNYLFQEIDMVTSSGLSKLRNVIEIQKISLAELKRECSSIINNRNRYAHKLRIRKIFFYSSLTLNLVVCVLLSAYLLYPIKFASFISKLNVIIPSLFP